MENNFESVIVRENNNEVSDLSPEITLKIDEAVSLAIGFERLIEWLI